MFGVIFWMVIAVIIAIDFVLKGIALWKAGNRKDLGWFVALFILNTAGILPAIYLLFFQKKKRKK
jgi:methionyl-tRNA synthetase